MTKNIPCPPHKTTRCHPSGTAFCDTALVEQALSGEGADIEMAGVTRVAIETEFGTILVDVDEERAPITAGNFLRYVDDGVFDEGRFWRTVTLDNQPDDDVRIEVIQGGVSPERSSEVRDPIPLERTTLTGLKHVDGAISMGRFAPDSAHSEFFICIGEQPELDFGGRRNPDGQGFAAFGRVVEGIDVVRTIQQSPCEQQQLTPPIRIERIRRI
jgi:peptidyl-prolyl cis-trans isomerase A (cyclophilin A)